MQQMGLACCVNITPCDTRTPPCGQAVLSNRKQKVCPLCLQVKSLEDCSHAFSFWEGVPTVAKHAFGRLFAAAPSLQVRLRALYSLMLHTCVASCCASQGCLLQPKSCFAQECSELSRG